MSIFKTIKNGIIDENPIFVQVIGMCPTLAVTTSVENGLGMGLATTGVLIASNFVISIIRNFIPDKIRIPAYVVVIATFVTIIQFLLEGFLPALNDSLGVFIPLIVVNCIILARAESFANKNNPIDSLFDGVGMGLGFTIALMAIGGVREFLGAGSILNFTILPESFPKTIIMLLPPGAFFTLGLLMALFNNIKRRRAN